MLLITSWAWCVNCLFFFQDSECFEQLIEDILDEGVRTIRQNLDRRPIGGRLDASQIVRDRQHPDLLIAFCEFSFKLTDPQSVNSRTVTTLYSTLIEWFFRQGVP